MDKIVHYWQKMLCYVDKFSFLYKGSYLVIALFNRKRPPADYFSKKSPISYSYQDCPDHWLFIFFTANTCRKKTTTYFKNNFMYIV